MYFLRFGHITVKVEDEAIDLFNPICFKSIILPNISNIFIFQLGPLFVPSRMSPWVRQSYDCNFSPKFFYYPWKWIFCTLK